MEKFINLPATERNNYIAFHEHSYQDNLNHSEKNMLEFPRWSVISGYYAMHDVTKLFLAKQYNIKVSAPDIHAKTIEALEACIGEEDIKRRLLKLLKEAKEIYFSVERLKERVLPAMLRKGKQERGSSQYYTEDYSKRSPIDSRKASYFLDTLVKPYVRLIEELMA